MLTLLAVPLLALLVLSTPSAAQVDQLPEATKQDPAEEPQEETNPPRFYWDNGLWFRAQRTDFRVQIGGQAQIDTTRFASDGSQPVEIEGDVEWRRARAYALGSFRKRWSFKFQWDFTTGRSPNLIDAWLGLEFKLWRQQLRVRSGRFSSTFGLENDGSSNDILFMEQGLTSAFVPPQETGVLLHSESNRRRWDFSFSSSADELDCLICSVTGVTGRYSTSFEFGREDRRLHVGMNYSRRWTDAATNYSERPESHIAPIFAATGAFRAERVDVGLAEGTYLDGAFSLQSEYGFTRAKRTELDTPIFHAFYVSTSYALTGEARPYRKNLGTIGRIRPKRELREGAGGLGAFEIAARFSYIDLNDKDIIGGKLVDFSFAFNWYPTYTTRVSFNVVRAARESWEPVWIFQWRLQLAL